MGVTTAGKVITSLEINNSQYMAALRNSQSKLADFAKTSSSSVSGMGRDFANLARSVVGITVAFQSLRKVIGEGMNFNKFVQEQTAAFSVMMKSADDAKAKIKELYNFAVASPLTFKETVGASKQLMAYGFAADTLVDNMKMLGTVAKATGHSLEDISYVYGTLKTQGRAYTRDLMQFAMRGIPIYEELAKVLGVDQKQIQKLTSEGKVGFAEVEQAFKNLTGEGGRFFGMMDEYMKTLPGQLSMLGDIAQQSAGRFASGITDALLKGLPGIMDALGDSSGAITALGRTLGNITVAMLKMAETLIRLTPLIKTFLILFITGKAIVALMGFPALMTKIGVAAISMATSMSTARLAIASTGMATASAAAGIYTLNASFQLLFATLLASPLFPVMLALAGIGVVVSSTIKAADKARADAASLKESNPQEALRQQLKNRVHGTSAEDPLGTAPVIATLEEVAKSAKDFGISMLDATQIYMETGLVTRGVIAEFKTLGDAARAAGEKLKWIQYNEKVKQDYTKAVQGQSWASTLEALGVDIMTAMKATSGVTSEPSVKGYMGMFTQGLPDTNIVDAMKTAGVKDTILADQTEDILKQKFKIVQDTLINVISRDFLNPEDTNPKLKEELAKLLNAIQLQLDGLGGGKAKEKIKEIERDIWYVRELETKATEDRMDDLVLAYDKENYTAREKLQQQKISLEEYYNAVYAIQQKFEDDSIKLAQEANMKLYNLAVGGDTTKWDRVKETAGAAIATGNYGQAAGAMAMGGMQGTEVGAMAMGADPMTQVLLSLVKFAQSIENLMKLLNPFGTVIESMGKVIGPILNVAFQGLSSVLEDVGYIIGSVLAPILNIVALAFQVVAGIIKIFILPPLALLGAAFAWFNDKVIVPIGNTIIKVFNAVIKALNMIPFVNIAYLDLLKTVEYAAELEDMLGIALDGLADTISYLTKKLNGMIDAQINSLQDLYEVGAISGAQYSAMVADANLYRIDTDLELVSLADQQLNTMEGVHNRLLELLQLQKDLEDPDLVDEEKLAMLIAAGIMTEANATPLPVQIIVPPAEVPPPPPPPPPPPTDFIEGISGGDFGPESIPEIVTATVDYEAEALAAIQAADAAAQASADAANAYAAAMAAATAIMEGGYGPDASTPDYSGYTYDGGGVSTYGGDNTGDWSWAVGSSNIPKDQFGLVHAGETIIPKTFADGIRSGEMVLSGKGGSSSMDSGNVTVIVNVQGSVSTENDLAASIAKNIYMQRKRGLLTV